MRASGAAATTNPGLGRARPVSHWGCMIHFRQGSPPQAGWHPVRSPEQHQRMSPATVGGSATILRFATERCKPRPGSDLCACPHRGERAYGCVQTPMVRSITHGTFCTCVPARSKLPANRSHARRIPADRRQAPTIGGIWVPSQIIQFIVILDLFGSKSAATSA